ncbi:MAG: hypothetical protein IKL41_02490 [Clostridia bacterium]|nr:hypothetical protein [Clostridia bacterium]
MKKITRALSFLLVFAVLACTTGLFAGATDSKNYYYIDVLTVTTITAVRISTAPLKALQVLRTLMSVPAPTSFLETAASMNVPLRSPARAQRIIPLSFPHTAKAKPQY